MKTKIFISILIGFLLGAATAWRAPKLFHHKKDPEARQKFLLKKFSSKLNLTKEQQDKVAIILNDKRKKIETLRADMKPRFEGIRQDTRKEIGVLLTKDQQIKYDILDAELSARWHK